MAFKHKKHWGWFFSPVFIYIYSSFPTGRIKREALALGEEAEYSCKD